VGHAEEEPLWAMRRGISPSAYLVRPNKIGEDVAVPRGRLLDALTGIRAIADAHDLPILTYGHVGDGNIHVNIMYDGADPSETTRADAATVEVMRLVRSMDGTLSGEHGVGMAKKEFLHLQLSPLETELMRQVKHSFDPLGIMNPDKAY
jgi:D-lactate dehydrogenase (cytochrome)/glycolate oxidase